MALSRRAFLLSDAVWFDCGDVGCLDHRRVIVKIGNVPYIHANYVATPNNSKRFICTQAPLPKTCSEFWCMVVQEKSKSVLMLCNFMEQVGDVKPFTILYEKWGNLDRCAPFIN
ncbi:hypothetical protein COOONC_00194 [Cooperia oncophora]